MKINEILKNKSTSLSFEVFPPKRDGYELSRLPNIIDELKVLQPDFISVTCGAAGTGLSGMNETLQIAEMIEERGQTALAHLTSIHSSQTEIFNVCQQLKSDAVENIMVLRGDPLANSSTSGDFSHASDLASFINQKFAGDFSLGGACYPETHPEAQNLASDLVQLKAKVDAGVDFLITQLFFDNQYYYRLIREAQKIGITVPIIAGVMPVINGRQIRRISKLCGTSIPASLATLIDKYSEDKAAMQEIGVAFATNQIIDLLANGVDGIHIYTMNRPKVAQAIFNNIPSVLKELNQK